ncbi:hypothetical protein WMF37_04630 [Sorangium sp. So ce291]|uniref:hypothetical protein n=1 Tax=Sorangium sp. So ce291 TaxID=3133294 RepID=UPI003F61DB9E
MRTLDREQGTTFLLSEQNATLALDHADFGHVLVNGRVGAAGTASELRARPDIRSFYLGIDESGRRRFGAQTSATSGPQKAQQS